MRVWKKKIEENFFLSSLFLVVIDHRHNFYYRERWSEKKSENFLSFLVWSNGIIWQTTISRVFVLRKHEGADFWVGKAGFALAKINFHSIGLRLCPFGFAICDQRNYELQGIESALRATFFSRNRDWCMPSWCLDPNKSSNGSRSPSILAMNCMYTNWWYGNSSA